MHCCGRCDGNGRCPAAPVRDLIAAGPAKESWAITPDHAMCIFAADTTPGGVGVMLRRAERMAELARGAVG